MTTANGHDYKHTEAGTRQYTKTVELGPRHLEQRTNRECSSHVPEPLAKQPRNYATNSNQKQVCSRRHDIICITASLKETGNTGKLEQTNRVPTRYQRVPKPTVNVDFRSGPLDGLPKGQRLRQLRSLAGRCTLQHTLRQNQEVAAVPWRKFRKKEQLPWGIKGL